MKQTDNEKRITGRVWIMLGALLCLLAGHFIWIASTWDGMGYTKDEGYYFAASRDNFGWYKTLAEKIGDGEALSAFEQRTIDRHWRNNHEHPPFCKTVQGFNHMLWYDWLGWFNFGNSHRMANVMFQWLLIAAMFFLATEWLGIGWAVFSILLLYGLPRFFFHAHLNTFDMPVVAMWFVIAFAFRKGMTNRRWAWLSGILLGIGLATKNNCYFLPVLFAIMYLCSPYRTMFFKSLANIPELLKRTPLYRSAIIASMLLLPLLVALLHRPAFNIVFLIDLIAVNLLIAFHWLRPSSKVPSHIAPILPPLLAAPLTFFLLWPWIWNDTWQRLGTYFNRHVNPPAWETYYLHEIVVNPPPFDWHYPFVMSAYTLPAVVVVFALAAIILLLTGTGIGQAKLDLWDKINGRKPARRAPLLNNNRNSPIIDAKWDQLFLLVNIILPILIIANPKTPIYGGTKHWATAQPFIAISIAMLLRWIVVKIGEGWNFSPAFVKALSFVLAALILVPGYLGIMRTHPNTLSYYNEFMGGSIAAPEVGMQRTFWAASSRGVLDQLNKIAPKGARVWWNNTPWDSFNAYKKDGFLRKDILRAGRMEQADFAVMNHWKYYTDGIYKLRRDFDAKYAESISGIDGLPLTELYRNYRKQNDKKEIIRSSPLKMKER